MLVVRGEIPNWPDVKDEFEISVTPPRPPGHAAIPLRAAGPAVLVFRQADLGRLGDRIDRRAGRPQPASGNRRRAGRARSPAAGAFHGRGPRMRARDNPFASERVLRVRYKSQAWTWEQLLARLEAMRYRAAIVGPHGSGKTTLLEGLEPLLAARGFATRYCRLTTENRSPTPAEWRRMTSDSGPHDAILLDGCEQLSWIGWWRFRRATRRAGGLIVTTHLAGRLPTLLRTTTSPALLAQIVRELAGDVATDLDHLYARHRGNLREALRELYDRSAFRLFPAYDSSSRAPVRHGGVRSDTDVVLAAPIPL